MPNINHQLTPHFHLAEFLCPGVTVDNVPSEIRERLVGLAHRLQAVRDCLGGKPMTITSGYRTVAHNRLVGGVANSIHLTGAAADIVVSGLSPDKVQHALKHWTGGMGCYASFTHLDCGTKRRWGNVPAE